MQENINYTKAINSYNFTHYMEKEAPRIKQNPKKMVVIIFDVDWQMKLLYIESKCKSCTYFRSSVDH